jgi:vacuolar protein sorting-associated protein 35
MEAIIQVFQDDFHLRTLGPLLEATGKLHAKVNVKQIIITFIDRLADYAKRERDNAAASSSPQEESESQPSSPKSISQTHRPGIPDEIKLFEVFWNEVTNVIQSREEFTVNDVAGLLVSLMNLTMSCYPDCLHYVQKIFAFAKDRFTGAKL